MRTLRVWTTHTFPRLLLIYVWLRYVYRFAVVLLRCCALITHGCSHDVTYTLRYVFVTFDFGCPRCYTLRCLIDLFPVLIPVATFTFDSPFYGFRLLLPVPGCYLFHVAVTCVVYVALVVDLRCRLPFYVARCCYVYAVTRFTFDLRSVVTLRSRWITRFALLPVVRFGFAFHTFAFAVAVTHVRVPHVYVWLDLPHTFPFGWIVDYRLRLICLLRVYPVAFVYVYVVVLPHTRTFYVRLRLVALVVVAAT